jgi:hypothetical protein
MASASRAIMGPTAPRSEARTGCPARVLPMTMAEMRRRRSSRLSERARMAMISLAAVMRKPEWRLLPSRCFLSGAVTLRTMSRRARSFMSRVRGQVMALGSRSSSLPWKRWESMRAASRLWAEVMAWKSPWKWRLIFSAGSIWELPPPAAPPFMPKTGPREGSREVMRARLPMRSRPWTRPMEVTVLPSPKVVGVVAVTRISLPLRLGWPSSSRSRETLALMGLRFS